MTDTSGWSPAGIASAIAIVAGIILLVVYAVRRGLVTRELDGTDEAAAAQAADDPTADAASKAPRRSNAGRPLGALGAILLVIGLGLGVMVATGNWGATGPSAPAGASGQEECAAGWEGCPKDTPKP
jgi:hypothetical protein